MSPDKLSLKAAQDASFSDVAVGDRVLVTGKISFDSKNIITKTVYLVKGSDLKGDRGQGAAGMANTRSFRTALRQ